MILAVIVYSFIFAADWGAARAQKKDRRFFILVCALGAALITLIMHGVRIPSSVDSIMSLLNFLGLHY